VRRKTQPRQIALRAAQSEDDYAIYVTTRRTVDGRFFGELLISRMTDGRKLFPFEGAPEIGPFVTVNEARDAAQGYGLQLVAADLANPEA